MKLLDLKKYQLDGNVIRDCEFDILGLIGKEYLPEIKVVTFLGSMPYVTDFLKSNMAGVFCTKEIADFICKKYNGGICIAKDPKALFFQFHNSLTNENKSADKKCASVIHPTAVINGKATIAQNDVLIGANVKIGSNTIIHEGVTIGDNVIIREGCVIGTPAFYYFGQVEQRVPVESAGEVLIEDDVEIHANVTICKGVLGGKTKIGRMSKVDSHVFIGHDVQIDDNCMIAANASFGGWSTLKSNVFVGVSASFAPGVIVEKNAKISIGAVVTTNVPEGTQYSGNFAVQHNKFISYVKSIASD